MKLLYLTFTIMFLASIQCPAGGDTNASARIFEFSVPEGFGDGVLREQPTLFTVQLSVGGRKQGQKPHETETGGTKSQVWLLKANGTSLPQLCQPDLISLSSIGDNMIDYMIYSFPKVPTNELAGIVVRIKGKLYCHDFTSGKK